MTIAQNSVAKLSVAFVTVAMLFSLVAPAQAQTVEELQAQIAALMAQIGSLSTTPAATTGSCVTPVAPLTMGSQGAEVTALQNLLISQGQTIAAGATGYFGGQTQAALAAWQAANGVTPAAGYYGPVTKAAMDAKCVPATNTDTDEDTDEDTTSGELGNDEGSIDVTSASADESSLEEGQEGGVLAFDVEVEGDVEIDRIDVYAAEDGALSEDAEDYFVRAFLMVDGEEVAEVEVDDFDQDDYDVLSLSGDDYRIRFSNLGLVFADNDEPEFQVGFEVVSNLDSADLAAEWDVEADEIRFVDGKGFSDTEVAGESDTFSFDEEETGDLDVQASSDNPDATTLKIEDGDDESDEYEVFVFEIEENNGVDVEINDLTVTITTTGNTDEDEVVEEAILYMGSEELGSEAVPNNGIVEFEDLGIMIDADATEEFTVALIFKGSDDAGMSSDVTVELTSIDDAEDANGNDETEMTIGGEGLESETHTLRTVVPVISDTSFEVDRNEAGDAGVISFTFTISAEDDDYTLNIGNRAAVDGAADDVRFDITGGDLGAEATTSISLISGDATDSGADYIIADGDEATFVVDVVFDAASAAGAYRVTVDTVAGIEVDETSGALNI
jgi:peptidoglycan hydrolase-like protein with peptidoglycan-binding domain